MAKRTGQAATSYHDCVWSPRLRGERQNGGHDRQEDPGVGRSRPPVPLDARRSVGGVVFHRAGRRRLDEVPLLVRLRDPHPAAVPHRLGLCRQHHRPLLGFRQRPGGRPRLSAGPAARPAYLRGRPQSGGRRHGRAAALRGAGPGGRGPVLGRHRHGHGHRPALPPGRRQMDRPLHALPPFLGERAPGPGRPARAGRRLLSRLETAEPDRRHVHRPQAARSVCRLGQARALAHFRLGPTWRCRC